MTPPAPFRPAAPRLLAAGLGLGVRDPGWAPLVERDLVVLVGLTGAGKSTATAALESHGIPVGLLPNRRQLTDQVILPLYAADGGAVEDRVERFALTRRFAAEHPAGMAGILAALALGPGRPAGPILFDGLRGETEVRHAATLLPRARFLVLTAPDYVRLIRLLRRRDGFDRAGATGALKLSDADLGDTGAVLSPIELRQLRLWLELGILDPAEVQAKLAIVAAERRNYDPDRTVAALLDAAPERSFIVDTSATPPEMIGALVARILRHTAASETVPP